MATDDTGTTSPTALDTPSHDATVATPFAEPPAAVPEPAVDPAVPASTGQAEPAAPAAAPQTRAKTKGVADIVFLIDVSGSMAPIIDALRKNIEAFVDSLSQGDAQQRRAGEGLARQGRRLSRHRGRDGRGPAVDRGQSRSCATPSRSRRSSPRCAPQGGGDEPESLLDALYKVATMEATPKGAQSRGAEQVALPQRRGARRRRLHRRVVQGDDEHPRGEGRQRCRTSPTSSWPTASSSACSRRTSRATTG